MTSIRFLPIDLQKNTDLCVKFRIDSFVCGFGHADSFYKNCGINGEDYLKWLKKIMEEDQLAALHIWEDNQIIGQLELTIRKDEKDEKYGYVNLFYLIPEKRGTGIGDVIHGYVEDHYRRLGYSVLRLTVSFENVRAIKYYIKHGWKEIGPRSDFPGTFYMEKKL